GDQMVEYLRTMSFLRDELESVLRLPSVDPLLAQIKRLFTSPEEKLTPFKVEQLERGVL
ncbi:MAG: hypothetical protein HYV42_01630, partial [Candidatus Magasanikbacteria bacterium]|nr:hypothetical protein [Candidatus Magasanikbacteria bacterium]